MEESVRIWINPIEFGPTKPEQTPPSLSVREGENITLHCKSSSTVSTLVWYRQDFGKEPVFLMMLTRAKEVKPQGRVTAQFGDKRKNSSLLIEDSQPEDSATYFCSVEAQ
uniref:Ig-like domain-containing protein n=1 Tax=Ornithorhynchus anatinus TaxID=9258 RepID=F6YW44_ORNAN